ncbi:MAG TPA: hypothetical protein VMV52_02455 [Candidatus Nanopelagicaceae bacterium]|nr:hypothetical protein [Candidatus Nanopelagicaceae bacterium]
MSQIRLDLGALGHLGGPDLEQAVERLAEPFELALKTRLLETFTLLVGELNIDLPDGRVDVRLDGDSVSLVFLANPEVPTQVRESREELDARVTLRMPEPLKLRMESAAASDRVSVNSWLLQVIEGRSATGSHSSRQLRGRGKS